MPGWATEVDFSVLRGKEVAVKVQAHMLDPAKHPGRLVADRPMDDAVLDTTPAAADASAGGPVQDVLLTLPADGDRAEPFPAITLTFRMDTTDLTAVVAETADLAYVISGNRGLQEFQKALNGTAVETFGGMWVPAPVRGEKPDIDDTPTPQRDRLRAAYETYLDRLPGRRAATEATVQATALARARQRLAISREQILAEARRYLSLADPSAAAAVLAGRGPNRLTGPETGGLVADLGAIAGERAVLTGLVAAQRHTQQPSSAPATAANRSPTWSPAWPRAAHCCSDCGTPTCRSSPGGSRLTPQPRAAPLTCATRSWAGCGPATRPGPS